jgi:hypothetical protein
MKYPLVRSKFRSSFGFHGGDDEGRDQKGTVIHYCALPTELQITHRVQSGGRLVRLRTESIDIKLHPKNMNLRTCSLG